MGGEITPAQDGPQKNFDSYLQIVNNSDVNDDAIVNIDESGFAFLQGDRDGEKDFTTSVRSSFLYVLAGLKTDVSRDAGKRLDYVWQKEGTEQNAISVGQLKEAFTSIGCNNETVGSFIHSNKNKPGRVEQKDGIDVSVVSKNVKLKTHEEDGSALSKLKVGLLPWSNCGRASSTLIEKLNQKVPGSVVYDKRHGPKEYAGAKNAENFRQEIDRDVEERTLVQLTIEGIHDLVIELIPGSDQCNVFQGYQGQYSALWWAGVTDEPQPFVSGTDQDNGGNGELRDQFGKGNMVSKSELADSLANFLKVGSFEHEREATEAWRALPITPNLTDLNMKLNSTLKEQRYTDIIFTVNIQTISPEAEQALREAYNDNNSTKPVSQLVMDAEFEVVSQLHQAYEAEKKQQAAEKLEHNNEPSVKP